MSLPRKHPTALPASWNPWTHLERLIGLTVGGYVVLCVMLCGAVWLITAHPPLLWYVLAGVGEGCLGAVGVLTLRVLVRRHLWHPLRQRAAWDKVIPLDGYRAGWRRRR